MCAIETIAKWHNFGDLRGLLKLNIYTTFYNSSTYRMKNTITLICQQPLKAYKLKIVCYVVKFITAV